MKRHEALVLAAVMELAIGSVRALAQSGNGPSDGGWVALAARVYGLPEPGSAPIPPGSREIWIHGGDPFQYCCPPMPLLHLVLSPGGERGELLLLQGFSAGPGIPAHVPRPGERCVPPRDSSVQGINWCVRPTTVKENWTRIARALDEFGVWQMAGSCQLNGRGGGSSDTPFLFIARSEGTEVRTYSCSLPSMKGEPKASALAIYEYFNSLFGPNGIPAN
jgi:hypothetical protein